MARPYWKCNESPEECAAELARREALLSRIKSLRVPRILLIQEMEKLGMRTTQTELSGALHGGRRGPKVDVMLTMISEILETMERREHESS